MLKTVTYVMRTLTDVPSSARKFAQRVAASLEERMASVLKEGESLTAAFLVLLQIVLGRMMEQAGRHLTGAEKAHLLEQRKERVLRQQRDEEADVLYRTLLDMRTTLDGTHGKGTAELYVGLDPGLGSVEALLLSRHAHQAVDVLGKPDFQLPQTTLKSTKLTAHEYVEEILTPLNALDATLQALKEQKRLTQEALEVKEKALAVARRLAVYGSRVLEGLYMIAGEEFHARRVRSKVGSASASAGEPADFEPPADGGETAPDDGEPAPPGADASATPEEGETSQPSP